MERVLEASKLLDGSYKVWIEKSAIRLWDLRGQTSPFSKKRAPNCTARTLRTEKDRSRWLFSVKCFEHYSKGPHIVRIRALPGKGHKLATRDVVVSCSCPFWVYWGPDYNAAQGGFSESIRSNGAAPNIRDPSRKNLICKHVWIVGRSIRDWIVPEPRKLKPVSIPAEPEFEEPRGIVEVPEHRRPPKEVVPPEEMQEEALPPKSRAPQKKGPKPPGSYKPIRPPKPPGEYKPLKPGEKPVKPGEETEEDGDEDFPVYLL